MPSSPGTTWTCGGSVSTGWQATYNNVSDGDCLAAVRVHIYAYRCFSTYIGDNTPANFYTRLTVKYTYTNRVCEDEASSSNYPCDERVEWHDICQLGPPGTLIQPDIANWLRDHFAPSSLANLDQELCDQITAHFYP